MKPEVVPSLMKALENDSPFIRAVAAKGIGQIEPPVRTAVPALVDLLADKDEGVRQEAADALGSVGTPAAAEQLIRSLTEDEDALVRSHAAEALGKLGCETPETVDALTAALKHQHRAVRGSAAQALGRLGRAAGSAVPALRVMAEKDDWEIARILASKALESIRLASEEEQKPSKAHPPEDSGT